MPDDWLTVDEIAKDLKVTIETVRNWIKSKQLPAYKVGRDYRIRRSDYETFLQKRKTTHND
jgi:excisionase family DNA binding protein